MIDRSEYHVLRVRQNLHHTCATSALRYEIKLWISFIYTLGKSIKIQKFQIHNETYVRKLRNLNEIDDWYFCNPKYQNFYSIVSLLTLMGGSSG